MPEARARGYDPGRFSFNVRGGRCEACEGDGVIRVEMHFLPDAYVTCDACRGMRYNRETLEIRYKGTQHPRSARDDGRGRARCSSAACRRCSRKLQTLLDVGPVVRAARPERDDALGRRGAAREARARAAPSAPTGRTLYILDEPTTGLHFHDIEQLLGVLHRLRDEGNTIVVIEHNLDVIKTADWVDRPRARKAARGGGTVVAQRHAGR